MLLAQGVRHRFQASKLLVSFQFNIRISAVVSLLPVIFGWCVRACLRFKLCLESFEHTSSNLQVLCDEVKGEGKVVIY